MRVRRAIGIPISDLLAPLCEARVAARKLIRANITAIHAVARELFDKGTLTQAEIDAAIMGNCS
jgi:hypothetical protein